jgi:methyltransferase family protein
VRDAQRTTKERARHWDSVYADTAVDRVSWYQDAPSLSLELIARLGVERDAAVIDVGGGASTLADHLVEAGVVDVSVLDVSAAALAEGRRRLGDAAPVSWLNEDLLAWRPERRFDLWHDRAVFHFLVSSADRETYMQTLRSAIRAEGFVVIATFASNGPKSCSGLPVARYSAAGLSGLLGAGFEVVETRREEHITPGGVMQPLTWVAGRVHPA